jgi:hypothetical protein
VCFLNATLPGKHCLYPRYVNGRTALICVKMYLC